MFPKELPVEECERLMALSKAELVDDGWTIESATRFKWTSVGGRGLNSQPSHTVDVKFASINLAGDRHALDDTTILRRFGDFSGTVTSPRSAS